MKPNLTLITGSGFSAESGLPTTTKLAEQFLDTPNNDVLPRALDEKITTILEEFWRDVFGFASDNKQRPSLEDHFTVLDLAANSGHHLGPGYSPRKLRAIRRMSIHRILHLLDLNYNQSPAIPRLFSSLQRQFKVSVVTLNWDIVTEKNLRWAVDYGIPVSWLDAGAERSNGVLLLKLHGSSNWVYCDSCRRVYAGTDGKTALHKKIFLEASDFDSELFSINGVDLKRAVKVLENGDDRACRDCGNRTAGRMATFSYRKAFSINQFQTIWDRAHAVLRDSDIWLFIGYSMSEADFEFRHVLKSAQLARKEHSSCRAKSFLRRTSRINGIRCPKPQRDIAGFSVLTQPRSIRAGSPLGFRSNSIHFVRKMVNGDFEGK